DILFLEKSRCSMLLLTVLILSGCYPVKYIDVSKEEEFQGLIGIELKTKKDLLALGVTFDANYRGGVDYVFVLPEPGISGPEVVFKQIIPKGTDFRITGVFEQNIFWGNRYLYKLNILNTDFLSQHTIVLEVPQKMNVEKLGIDRALFEITNRGACKSNCVTAHASVPCKGGYHEQHNERQRP